MTTLAACGGADLPPGVTIDGILALRPGMSYEEVVRTIGTPVPTVQTDHGHVVWIYFRRSSTGIYGYSIHEKPFGSADTLRQVFPR